MLYIPKNNLVTGDKKFIAGQKYTFKEVEGCDLSNFQKIGEEEAAALDAAQSKKGQPVQPASAGETKTPEGAEEII